MSDPKDPKLGHLLSCFPPLGAHRVEWMESPAGPLPRIHGEFWTASQRQGHSLHEISYRACYKPELPGLFIRALTQPGEAVHDPFGGRGTTALEAALQGRQPLSNDVNPLSAMLLGPRLCPPDPAEVEARLEQIPRQAEGAAELDLSMFFHPGTESELRALRAWFRRREEAGIFDGVDAWLRMVALNRLTGHSAGFFSVYSLPPNQAVSARKQAELNAKRNQVPAYRDTHALILKKTRSLLRSFTGADDLARLREMGRNSRLFTGSADHTPGLPEASADLVVTSPPFLDVVQYHRDNWMRNWFAGVDEAHLEAAFIYERRVEAWCERMGRVFREQHRILRPGGAFVIEVGEVKKGTLRMEELLLPLGDAAGFRPEVILVNTQAFTKTAHIWGVTNNTTGTNSQRMVVFRKA